MKPDWCPQWAWDGARPRTDQMLADMRDRRFLKWLFSATPTLIDTFSSGGELRSLDAEVQEEIATAWQAIIARALLQAHQRGRREGMEEAAKVAAAMPGYMQPRDAAAAIRAKMEEQP